MVAEAYMPMNAMPMFARKSPEARREAWNRFLPGASRSNASADTWSPEL